jgi:hypothetical protein
MDVILRYGINSYKIIDIKKTYQVQEETPVSDQTYYNISAVFQARRSMHRDTRHILQV